MTILEEEKQSCSTAPASTGTKIPSSIIKSGNSSPGTGPSSASTGAGVPSSSPVNKDNSPRTSTASHHDINNTGAKNHILNSMISNVADRYITPEYLAPLPSAEKSGKSPLQLLAQTCSQIGADPGSNKINLDKTKEKSKAGSPALIVSDNASPNNGGGTQVVSNRPVSFKPYETDRKKANKTPSSVVSLSPSSGNNNNTASPSSSKSPSSATSTSSKTTTSEATPVIRSGMEVLAGHPKDLPLGLYANPAFRPPLAGGSSAYASSLLPPTTLAASLAAAAAGSLGNSVCRDPYCRDPTCPTAMYNAQIATMLMGTGLPPGYAELLQAHKASSTAAAAAAAAGAGPYICNWMNGREGYCGKRHNSAEELLQHLRTHTNLSTSDSAIYSASAAAAASSFSARSYGGAMSSLPSAAASRFHPYAAAAAAAAAAAKTSALPSSLSALGAATAGLPPPLPPGLPPSLYSPSSLYASLYGARLAGSLP